MGHDFRKKFQLTKIDESLSFAIFCYKATRYSAANIANRYSCVYKSKSCCIHTYRVVPYKIRIIISVATGSSTNFCRALMAMLIIIDIINRVIGL